MNRFQASACLDIFKETGEFQVARDLFRITLALAFYTAITGCGANQVAQTQLQAQSKTQTKAAQSSFPMPVFGAHGNINPQKNHPTIVAVTGHSGKRSSKAVLDTTQQEFVGVSFTNTDLQGYQITDLTEQVVAQSTLQLPQPSSGTNTLIASDTIVGSDSCMEVKVVYFRSAGDADTTRRLDVYDTCANVEYAVATIDSTFQSNYEIEDGNGDNNNGLDWTIRALALKNSAGSAWQLSLVNSNTSEYDVLWNGTQNASAYAGGQSIFNIDTFAPGNCPQLPTQRTWALNGMSLSNPNYTLEPLPETVIYPQASGGATPECFSSAYASSPYYYEAFATAPNPLGSVPNTGYTIITETSTATPPPTPTPTPTPTATPAPTPTPSPTPTATPTAIPTATPTPSPSPTPTASANPYFNVTVNTPTIVASKANGSPQTFTCALTIKTSWVNSWSQEVTDYGGQDSNLGGPYPLMDYPQATNLAFSIPSLSVPVTNFTNQGSPGGKVFIATTPENVCVNLILTIPTGTAVGSYSAVLPFGFYVKPPSGPNTQYANKTVTVGFSITN